MTRLLAVCLATMGMSIAWSQREFHQWVDIQGSQASYTTGVVTAGDRSLGNLLEHQPGYLHRAPAISL